MAALAQQKKRRLEDEAQEYNGEYNQMVGPQLPGAERLPDSHRVHILEGKLEHLRSWMKQLAAMMETTNLHAVQNSKRLFVGGLPHDVTQEELVSFLNDCINTSGANVGTGNAVVSCRIQQEKNFAFVELRSAEEATNVIALDGVCLRGEIALKIKRPTKFDSQTAAMLGPSVPDPTIDLRGLIINKPANAEHGYQNSGRYERNWNTLYVGGLPMEWTELQVAELLKNYGQLKYLKLMQDKETGRSRGFAFCEFMDEAATTAALQQLNGYQVMGRFITVNRPMEHKAQLSHQQQQQQQQQQMGMMGSGMGRGMGGGGMIGASAGSGGGMMGSGMGGGVPMQPGLGASGMAGTMGTGMDGYGLANQGMGIGNQGMGMGGGMQGSTGMGSSQMQQGSMGGYGQQGGGYGNMQQQGDMSGGYNTGVMGGGGMGGGYNQQQQQQDMYGGQQGMGLGVMSAAGTQQGNYGATASASGMTGGYNMQQGGYADVGAAVGMGGAQAAPAGPGVYGQPALPSGPASNTPKAGLASLAGAGHAAAGSMGGPPVAGMPPVAGAMGAAPMGQQSIGGQPQWQQQQQGGQQQYGNFQAQQPQQQYSSFPGYPGQQQQWQQ